MECFYFIFDGAWFFVLGYALVSCLKNGRISHPQTLPPHPPSIPFTRLSLMYVLFSQSFSNFYWFFPSAVSPFPLN